MPMILGLAVASLVTGRLVSSTGRWKRYLVGGSITATVGLSLLATIDAHTSFLLLIVYMALLGIGLGMTMQNLVLSVQNTVPVAQLGAATATVSFFRSLGGAIGVSVLGAVLGTRVADSIARGLARTGVPSAGSDGAIPDVNSLPAPVARIVEDAYGSAVGHVFLLSAPLMLLAVLLISCIKEVPLRQKSGTELSQGAEAGGAAGAVAAQPVEHVAEQQPVDGRTTAGAGR
jgi:MFS family permease